MQRINSVDGLFHEGNPATGQKGTKVTEDFLNSLQEEICGVVEAAGLELDPAKNDQLVKAIGLLGPWGDVRNYASLAAAVASIGAEKKTLLIPVDVAVTADLVIPVNIQILAINGAKINHGAYTISGPGLANTALWPLTQIFNGTGAVSGFTSTVRAEWFGGRSVAGADDAPAINKALVSGAPVCLTEGDWNIKSSVNIPSGGSLRGEGRGTVLIIPNAGFVGERVITNSDIVLGNTDIQISDLSFQVTSELPVSGVLPGIMRLQMVTGLDISRIYTKDFNSQFTVIDLVGGIKKASVTNCDLKNKNLTSGGCIWVRSGQASGAQYNSSEIVIADNIAESASDEAITVYGWQNNVDQVAVTGNTIKIAAASNKPCFSVVGHDSAGQTGTATNVIVSGNSMVGQFHILTAASVVNVTGNTMVGPSAGAEDALFIGASGGDPALPTGIKITGNIINGASRNGIFNASPDADISDNTLYNCTAKGVDNYGVGSFITGNSVENCNINIKTSTKAFVTGNKTKGGTYGIQFSRDTDFSSSVCSDNIVEGATTVGININGIANVVNNLRVTRNTIFNLSGTTPTGLYWGNGTYNGCLLSDNQVSNATTAYTISTTIRKLNNMAGDTLAPWPVITGTDAQRPTALLGANDGGFLYRSTTPAAGGVPYWWNGTGWAKSDGTIVA